MKWNIKNEIITGRNESEEQKSIIKNIKRLYESQEKFVWWLF